MASASGASRARKKLIANSSGTARNEARPREGESRFERKFREIEEHATVVFYEKGYEGASMRDLSRVSGMSLAGLYYYFESKEKLLYLIQQHTFETVIARLHERLRGVSDPEQRMRVFIENHLEYFLANMKAMKVLSHEAATLRNSYGEEIQAIKREYYQLCRTLLEELLRSRKMQSSPASGASRGAKPSAKGPNGPKTNGTRVAVLSLFGMMNWIYTWYNPQADGDAGRMAATMANIYLSGVLDTFGSAAARKSAATRQRSL